MVVLVVRDAVVEGGGGAAFVLGSQGAEEALGLRVNLGEVVVGAGNLHRRPQVGGAVFEGQLAA